MHGYVVINYVVTILPRKIWIACFDKVCVFKFSLDISSMEVAITTTVCM